MKSKLPIDKLIDKIQSTRFESLPEEIKEYRREVLTINENKVPRNLFLYPVTKTHLEKANKEFVSIFTALSKLAKYIIHNEPELLKFIGKDGIDVEGLKKRAPETLLGYARIDTIFSDNVYKVLEFNSRRPQMYEDADWFSRYISNLAGSENIIPEENGLEVVKSIHAQFNINTKKEHPENIVVLNNFPNQKYSFSSVNRLKNYFNKSNLFFFTCPQIKKFYEEIENVSGELIYKGKRIDLIILQSICGSASLFTKNGSIRIQKIRDSFNKNKVEIYTLPSGQISGTKLSLDLIQNKQIQWKIDLTQDEIEAVKTIPYSIHSDNITDFRHFNKDDYVLKLTGLGQGMGVKLGINTGLDEWIELLQKYADKNEKFLLQEKINLSHKSIISLQDYLFENAFITLEPFVVNNPLESKTPMVTGYASRATPIHAHKEGMKFNPAYDKQEIYFGSLICVD